MGQFTAVSEITKFPDHHDVRILRKIWRKPIANVKPMSRTHGDLVDALEVVIRQFLIVMMRLVTAS